MARIPAQSSQPVKRLTSSLLLILLFVACFSMATLLQPQAAAWGQRGQESVLQVLLGDGRWLLANHFFTKADVYFHSGYYPTIFDRKNPHHESHMAGHSEGAEHEEEEDFLGPPRDWLERFGRHAMITKHTHLENGQEREILPWLKIAAELDPHIINTYTVAAYWLANQLHKVPEAEQFLHEGMRANPDSYEILFSLGRLYYENDHDSVRARNVWQLALRRWKEQDAAGKQPEKFSLEKITVNLARLEENERNLARAIQYFEQAKAVSPAPQSLARQIEDLKRQLASAPQSGTQAP
jgi:tetratricopeptide (TPR) repeat protein